MKSRSSPLRRSRTLARRTAAAVVTAATVVGLVGCGSGGPDVVLLNGRIFTANPSQPWAEAIAITGERITAVGETSAILANAPSETRRIDLGGRLVIPGMIDPSVSVGSLTPDAVRAIAADAHAVGVTSLSVHADGPVAEAVKAFVTGDTALRATIFRRPQPQADGHTDSRPFFPPQPTPRINVRGMSFTFTDADLSRLDLVVGWAYGSEDPLSVRAESPAVVDAFLRALAAQGTAHVWRAKRPRIQGPVAIPPSMHARLHEFGVVVVQHPGEDASLRSLLAAGVALALSAEGDAFASLSWATERAPMHERVPAVEALQLMTAAAAYAEFSERDKGQLTVGRYADLVVLASDVFGTGSFTPPVRSVLTMVGGAVVRHTGAIQ